MKDKTSTRMLFNAHEKGQKKMFRKQSIEVMASICLIWCLAVVSSVQAEDSTKDSDKGSSFKVKEGTYIGVLFVNNKMSGDFDGSTFYTSPSKAYDVPDLDDGTGFGIVLGYRLKNGAIELDYQQTTHDTSSSFMDVGKQKATYHVIDLNLKFDVFARDRLRPYILVGLGFPWITITDSATDGSSYDDETFTGFALNAGIGLAYYFHPQWAITGGLVYRWNRFSSIDGKSLDNNLKEKALNLTVGIAYTF